MTSNAAVVDDVPAAALPFRAYAQPTLSRGESGRMLGVLAVVVIGVSGAGKSTIARGCAQQLGWPMAEGDDFHPPANVAKMRRGIPLDDQDRWGWLQSIAAWIGGQEAIGGSAVVSCSALKRAYRDVLRDGHPSVRFLQLDVPAALLAERVADRSGHFMPASLLQSQLATLEPLGDDEPGARVEVDGMSKDRTIAAAIAQIARWESAAA